jgi:hypothetical protein
MRFAIVTLITVCFVAAAQAQVTIKAANKLQAARTSRTIELTGAQLAPLNARDLMTVHIKDASGKEVIAQAVDTDFDARHVPDMVIFQADFAPGETKTFTASVGAKQVYTEEQFKARGRFVRERFDDFNWENDRIAHRMYGKWLETWEGEPLTSSTIDIWSKRTPKMVTDKWYMVDNYHADTGEGADFYSAGRSRGVGGSGLWANNQLFVSKNFVQSRVLSNGPIRVLFELEYEPFDVAGAKVSEVKRISLDGGSQLDHYQSFYKVVEGQPALPLTVGIGLKKVAGEEKAFSAEKGYLAKWERVEKNAGMQGLAAIVDPKVLVQQTEDQLNLLLLAKADANNSVSYWAGFCWDKAGLMTDLAGWKAYVEQFTQGLASPIEVSVGQ